MSTGTLAAASAGLLWGTNAEAQAADRVLFAVLPAALDRGRRLVVEAVARPLRARDAEPEGLLAQAQVERLITSVDADLGFGPAALERGDAADVIQVRVRERDGL